MLLDKLKVMYGNKLADIGNGYYCVYNENGCKVVSENKYFEVEQYNAETAQGNLIIFNSEDSWINYKVYNEKQDKWFECWAYDMKIIDNYIIKLDTVGVKVYNEEFEIVDKVAGYSFFLPQLEVSNNENMINIKVNVFSNSNKTEIYEYNFDIESNKIITKDRESDLQKIGNRRYKEIYNSVYEIENTDSNNTIMIAGKELNLRDYKVKEIVKDFLIVENYKNEKLLVSLENGEEVEVDGELFPTDWGLMIMYGNDELKIYNITLRVQINIKNLDGIYKVNKLHGGCELNARYGDYLIDIERIIDNKRVLETYRINKANVGYSLISSKEINIEDNT